MSVIGLIPKPWRLGISIFTAGALILGAGALYLQHRAAIYRDGWDDAHAQIEKELDLQEAANREAMRLAALEYGKSTETILTEQELLNASLEALEVEALADPGADACGIGLGSVQRLNAIR
jgi:hypothetical protein